MYPFQVGKLAALIVSNVSSPDVSTFTDDNVPIKTAISFVYTILMNMPEGNIVPKAQQALLVRVWVRHCLLMPNTNQTFHQRLTRAVLKLPTFRKMCSDTICTSSNPVCSFIKEMAKYASSSSVEAKELLEVCFGSGESWVAEVLTQPTSESQVIYMYTCIALLVYHCARLLYDKTRSNCVLSRYVLLQLEKY